jgi:hypothetical protein
VASGARSVGSRVLQAGGRTSNTVARAPTPAGPICFIAGTRVLAADGSGSAVAKAIEDIELGDLVWARCEFTGEEGFKPVLHLFRNSADRLVHLSYRRDPGSARRGATGSRGGDADEGDDPATITGTDEHPFWSLTRDAWVEMAAQRTQRAVESFSVAATAEGAARGVPGCRSGPAG